MYCVHKIRSSTLLTVCDHFISNQIKLNDGPKTKETVLFIELARFWNSLRVLKVTSAGFKLYVWTLPIIRLMQYSIFYVDEL